MLNFGPEIQRAELEWIAAFQGSGDFRRIMLWFSYPGAEALKYVLPFTYFVLSRKAGARLYVLYGFSGWLLETLKVTFHLPRPYWVDPRIRGLSTAGNYGMPSGHTLGASVVWPGLAHAIKKPWAWVSAFAMVLLVSVSRVYLGVHFISDVAGAWIVAAALIAGVRWLETRTWNRLDSAGPWSQIGIALGATITLLALGIGANRITAGVVDPQGWSIFATKARNLSEVFQSSGTFFGAACGAIMAGRWARFEVRGVLWRRGIALVYALAGAWLLRQLYKLLPNFHVQYAQLSWEFLRSAISTWWILFLAPWILIKADLVTAEAPISNMAQPGCAPEQAHQ